MLNMFRKKKGFTLIELMVVVAILAILAIIAIPRILEALDNARDSEVRANAASIANAMSRYYIENPDTGYPAPSTVGAVVGLTNNDLIDYLQEEGYLDLRGSEENIDITRYKGGGDDFLFEYTHNEITVTIGPEEITYSDQ